MDQQNDRIIRVTEVDTDKLKHFEEAISRLREDSAVRQGQMDQLQKGQERLEHAVFGNGKEGLTQTVTRMELKVDHIYQFIEDIPELIVDKVTHALDRFALNINTGKMKAIARDEARRFSEAPGGWMEFRSKLLLPLLFSVITALIGAYIGARFLAP